MVSGSRDLESSIKNGGKLLEIYIYTIRKHTHTHTHIIIIIIISESPTKKRCLESNWDMASGGHNNTDVQISEPMEINDNLEMDAVKDCSRRAG